MQRPWILLATLTVLPALAQGAYLTLSPARVELAAMPGEAFSLTTTLRNEGPREEAVTVRLASFQVKEDGSVEELPLSGGLCAELRVIPTAFTLPPGGSLEVRVEGKSPEGEGTLACLVVFSGGLRIQEKGGVGLQIRPEIGLALYVTLRGTERPALRATVGGEGRSLLVLLENPGNVLQRVSGKVEVFSLEGKRVASFSVEELPVWPGGARRLEFEPPEPLPPGEYRVVVILESPYGRYASEGKWTR